MEGSDYVGFFGLKPLFNIYPESNSKFDFANFECVYLDLRTQKNNFSCKKQIFNHFDLLELS